MATAGDLRTQIKSDLTINGTEYDTQILNAIHSALRELRGKRYWFLEAYTTKSTTIASESVALPTDFSAPKSFEMLYSGSRLSDGYGFNYYEFERLKRDYWTTSPLRTGPPEACAVFAGVLYLSCLADAVYTIPVTYYKQDATLPASSDTSVWFDDGYDVVRSSAQFIFKRDSQDFTPGEEDGGMMQLAMQRLDDTHNARMAGR